MSVSYTPVFTHKLWVDNFSLVQAAGDDGFNVRFQGLEAEFRQIAVVVGQISAALDALSTVPPSRPVTLSMVPVLTTVDNKPWSQNADGVVKPPSPATECTGVMNLQLPQGAQLQSLRAIGAKTSGTLTIKLFRQAIVAGAISQAVVTVTAADGPLDQTVQVTDAAMGKVDNENFRYYLVAKLSGAGAGDSVALSTFQIVYTGSR